MIHKGCSSNWPDSVLIYTDGASRGNPGLSATGLVVYACEGSLPLYEEGALLPGRQTNNFAEYSAVLRSLKLACENKVRSITLKSDSELLVKQLNGIYKVKSSNIKTLYKQCCEFKKNIPRVQFKHVFRKYNVRADELANLALDGLDIT